MIWGGAKPVMLKLGSGCKYRLSLAERFDCTETIINQLFADSYQNPISEWQVKTSSGLPLILHYGELYNYFIISYNVIIIEIKCTINVMYLNHPETIPNPPVHGKIVFHETDLWCQKGWGPLVMRLSIWQILYWPSFFFLFPFAPLFQTKTLCFDQAYVTSPLWKLEWVQCTNELRRPTPTPMAIKSLSFLYTCTTAGDIAPDILAGAQWRRITSTLR